jgi:hypothetical protein
MECPRFVYKFRTGNAHVEHARPVILSGYARVRMTVPLYHPVDDHGGDVPLRGPSSIIPQFRDRIHARRAPTHGEEIDGRLRARRHPT